MLTLAHAWTRKQRWLIVTSTAFGLLLFAVVVYGYERYYRGPSDSVLFGTWRCTSGCYYALYYQFTPEHKIRVFADDDPSAVIGQGRWYAGGGFVFLRFPEPVPGLDRPTLGYQIRGATA